MTPNSGPTKEGIIVIINYRVLYVFMVSNAHCGYTSLHEYVYLFFYFILFIIIIFFCIRPPPGLLPVLGQLEQYRLLHLTQPCLIALGRVLFWVEHGLFAKSCARLCCCCSCWVKLFERTRTWAFCWG